jgi:tetratricopeptide (TPR) repeat protein
LVAADGIDAVVHRGRRLRQQVADLYLKLGKLPEGDKHLRELAKQLRTGGKERMAIGVYKQIIKLKPDDAPLYGEMGDCYAAASLPQDAKASWTRAIELLSRGRPDQAIIYVEKLIRLEPGELVHLGVEEQLEGWSGISLVEWAERAPDVLPLDHLEVHLELTADGGRRLRARSRGSWSDRSLPRWVQAWAFAAGGA